MGYYIVVVEIQTTQQELKLLEVQKMKTIESIENLMGDVTLYTALVSLSVALIVILLAP